MSGPRRRDPASQGLRFDGLDEASRLAALACALEYRGDVTLTLADGSAMTGYLYAHDTDGAEPRVRLYPARPDAPAVDVPTRRIVAVELTGEDKASGRTWEAWVRRNEEKRRLLERGIDVGDIEPTPEPLD